MRLINTSTLAFEEFHGDYVPKYAILSHRWDKDEITFQEWNSAVNRKKAEKKLGYKKIEATCRLARQRGLGYAWIDTNCIDKSSSAELSEAINSMWRWYGGAVVCFAFLGDVGVGDEGVGEGEGKIEGGKGGNRDGDRDRDQLGILLDKGFQESFRKSRWFTRGWTLQELLAPSAVVFYSREWIRLGDKSSTLTQPIGDATGIDTSYLLGYSPISAASVSLRMFWLSRRKTTRVEDMAYCMLGIFDINMPLLYGEGTKAFLRLQEEIIKVSVDHTIFCWSWSDSISPAWTNLIAPSPDAFKNSQDFRRASTVEQASPYAMTNAGLSIRLPIIQAWSYNFIILMVHHRRRAQHWRACIPVRSLLRPSVSDFLGTYRRIPYPADPIFMPITWASTEINMFVKSKMMSMFHHTSLTPRNTNSQRLPRAVLITLGEGLPSQIPVFMSEQASIAKLRPMKINSIFLSETYPPERFDETRSLLRLDHRVGDAYVALLALGDRESGCVVFVSCKIDLTRRTKWFCHILPSAFWADSEVKRAKLLAFLGSQVAGLKGDNEIRLAVCKEIRGYIAIDGDDDEDEDDIDGECERRIVAARLEIGLKKEKIVELSKRIVNTLHL
ncbi:hypothetical protein SBOR_6475 [Sclerotinia borealis F-4128]|uniref:Heterokaryon incompatibility domain-containing protein n=1 Tax=Sclerotinia borealis (strain F-4128) TaxID=1432307 RepID=W9CBE6_SCLBF|nr:hypothetical protein SBOR_6475 [Sclerotinia borealis F-4128]